MSKLEKALTALKAMETRGETVPAPIGGVPLTITVVFFLAILLSIPVTDLKPMLLMALWLAIGAPWLGVSFTSLVARSLVVLPFIALIGIFNPLINTRTAFWIYDIPVSYGWLSFAGIILRGILCVQAALMLIESLGFRALCLSLGRLGMPKFLTNLLLMVYRYIKVLLEEAITMNRARQSRGYGRRKLPIRMWAPFVGQLFLRSINRAEKIHRAMLSRGFNGEIPSMFFQQEKWKVSDTIWTAISATFFVAVRIWGI